MERGGSSHLLYVLVRLQSQSSFIAYLQNKADGNDFVARRPRPQRPVFSVKKYISIRVHPADHPPPQRTRKFPRLEFHPHCLLIYFSLFCPTQNYWTALPFLPVHPSLWSFQTQLLGEKKQKNGSVLGAESILAQYAAESFLISP